MRGGIVLLLFWPRWKGSPGLLLVFSFQINLSFAPPTGSLHLNSRSVGTVIPMNGMAATTTAI
uniref:Uncharacterized protein n=1 Tax=Picea glauca TaxID=3330 RepID=A0A101M4K6_PICGL|nr:hypothetical protein ABT39_MTgene628 [Picea glauca]